MSFKKRTFDLRIAPNQREVDKEQLDWVKHVYEAHIFLHVICWIRALMTGLLLWTHKRMRQ